MNTADRGAKHICPSCASRYYDMKRDVVACPKCGAKPAAPKLPRSSKPVRKSGHPVFR